MQIRGAARIVNSINLEAGLYNLEQGLRSRSRTSLPHRADDRRGREAKRPRAKLYIAQAPYGAVLLLSRHRSHALIFDCLSSIAYYRERSGARPALDTIEGIRHQVAHPDGQYVARVLQLGPSASLPLGPRVYSTLPSCTTCVDGPGPRYGHPTTSRRTGRSTRGAQARRRPRLQPSRGRLESLQPDFESSSAEAYRKKADPTAGMSPRGAGLPHPAPHYEVREAVSSGRSRRSRVSDAQRCSCFPR